MDKTVVSQLSRFTRSEIDILFKTVLCTHRSRLATVLFSPAQNNNFSRILIVTSRKVGNAVARNYLRRRLKAIFYESEYYKQQFDCAIIARPGTSEQSFEELKQLLNKAYFRLEKTIKGVQ